MIVIRFTHEGILVKSILVPDVEATAVPDVITLDAIELTTAPVIVGLVSVCPVAVVIIVPLVAGNVSVVVPDTAGAAKVTVPDVSPATTMLAII